jgi:hypothetical protein
MLAYTRIVPTTIIIPVYTDSILCTHSLFCRPNTITASFLRQWTCGGFEKMVTPVVASCGRDWLIFCIGDACGNHQAVVFQSHRENLSLPLIYLCEFKNLVYIMEYAVYELRVSITVDTID